MNLQKTNRTLRFLLAWLLVLLSLGCTVSKTSRTAIVQVRDSVVRIDTVMVPIKVYERQSNQTSIDALQNSNDSLVNRLASQEAKLARQAELLKAGKLSIDTMWAYAGPASAWACVRFNRLHVGVDLAPVDTVVPVLTKNVTVSNVSEESSIDHKTITITKPFFMDVWFWMALFEGVILGTVLLHRLGVIRLRRFLSL